MRFLSLFFCLLILLIPISASAATDSTESTSDISVFAVPSGDLNDLSYYVVDSDLGEITLYLPHGISSNALQLFSGTLVNTTNSTIYPFCPEYPEYTFQASRWSSLTYRANATGVSSRTLSVSSVLDVVDQSSGFSQIYIFLLLSILFALLVRRSFS